MRPGYNEFVRIAASSLPSAARLGLTCPVGGRCSTVSLRESHSLPQGLTQCGRFRSCSPQPQCKAVSDSRVHHLLHHTAAITRIKQAPQSKRIIHHSLHQCGQRCIRSSTSGISAAISAHAVGQEKGSEDLTEYLQRVAECNMGRVRSVGTCNCLPPYSVINCGETSD